MDAALLHSGAVQAGQTYQVQYSPENLGYVNGALAPPDTTRKRTDRKDSADHQLRPASKRIKKSTVASKKGNKEVNTANLNDGAPTLSTPAPYYLPDEVSRLPALTPQQVLRAVYPHSSIRSQKVINLPTSTSETDTGDALSQFFSQLLAKLDFSCLNDTASAITNNLQSDPAARVLTNDSAKAAQSNRLFSNYTPAEHSNYVNDSFDPELENDLEGEVYPSQGTGGLRSKSSAYSSPNAHPDICVMPSSLIDNQSNKLSGMLHPPALSSDTPYISNPCTSGATTKSSATPRSNISSIRDDISAKIGYDADLVSDGEDELKLGGKDDGKGSPKPLFRIDARFFGPDWEEIIENVEWSVCLYLMTENGFPSKEELNARIPGYISAAVRRFERKYFREPSYHLYNKYFKYLLRLIRRRVLSFRGELIIICRELVQKYGFIPTNKMSRKDLEATIIKGIEKLFSIENLFIQDGCDDNGLPNFFSHPVLREVCLVFAYLNEFSIACRYKTIFFSAFPEESMALVASGVACCLCEHSTGKFVPVPFDFARFRPIYAMLMKIIKALEGSNKLDSIREEWANAGVDQLNKAAQALGLLDIGSNRSL